MAVHYSPGALLLSEAATGDGRAAKLLLAARNPALPAAAAVNTGLASGVPGLREVVAEMEQLVPGETAALAAAPPAPLLGPDARGAARGGAGQDELSAQIFSPPQRFVLISTAGTLELERRRPVDVLAALLAERDAARLAQFFAAFGAAEAAAMCFMLAAGDVADVPAVRSFVCSSVFLAWLGLAWLGFAWLGLAWLHASWLLAAFVLTPCLHSLPPSPPSTTPKRKQNKQQQRVAEEALAALDNPALVGEPSMPEDAPAGGGGGAGGAGGPYATPGAVGGIHMGV